MKLTATQLKAIIKEEIENKSADSWYRLENVDSIKALFASQKLKLPPGDLRAHLRSLNYKESRRLDSALANIENAIERVANLIYAAKAHAEDTERDTQHFDD